MDIEKMANFVAAKSKGLEIFGGDLIQTNM